MSIQYSITYVLNYSKSNPAPLFPSSLSEEAELRCSTCCGWSARTTYVPSHNYPITSRSLSPNDSTGNTYTNMKDHDSNKTKGVMDPGYERAPVRVPRRIKRFEHRKLRTAYAGFPRFADSIHAYTVGLGNVLQRTHPDGRGSNRSRYLYATSTSRRSTSPILDPYPRTGN